MLSQSPHWVAIYTRSRAEKRLAELLDKQGYVCYLPTVERRHRWSDRYKLVEEPLFRSYLFVKIRNTDVERVRAMAGVCHIVSFGGVIATVPEEQIDAIQRLVASKQELFVRQSDALRKGTRVRIVEGQYAGLEGLLVSKCKEGNFAVRIDAIGAVLITSIDRLLLQPLGPHKEPRIRKMII